MINLLAATVRKGRAHPSAYVPPITGFHDLVYTWSSIANADSYTLYVGTSSGASNVFDGILGDVVTYTVSVQSGHYWGRVLAYQTSTLLATLVDSTVTV